MDTQSEITIKVPLEIAQFYQNATDKERDKMQEKIAFFLKTYTISQQEAVDKLHKTMDEIGQEAVEKGLTPEILESILNEDE